jgi:hypothetical protein
VTAGKMVMICFISCALEAFISSALNPYLFILPLLCTVSGSCAVSDAGC